MGERTGGKSGEGLLRIQYSIVELQEGASGNSDILQEGDNRHRDLFYWILSVFPAHVFRHEDEDAGKY